MRKSTARRTLLLLNGPASLEIDNGMLERLRLDTRPEWGLDKQSPEWVIERVLANAHLHQRRP